MHASHDRGAETSPQGLSTIAEKLYWGAGTFVRRAVKDATAAELVGDANGRTVVSVLEHAGAI